MKKADFILVGGGMAGLSLAYYLSTDQRFRGKSILLIEPEEKRANDRTWAFWQRESSAFDSILFRTWSSVRVFSSENIAFSLDMEDYTYKLLRGIDFYQFVQKELAQNPHFQLIIDKSVRIEDTGDAVEVTTKEKGIFTGSYVFDSSFPLEANYPYRHYLKQHFKGYVVDMERPVFDTKEPEMMNFAVEQLDGECTFIYILPFTETTALVELTLFSPDLLTDERYIRVLEEYLTTRFSGLKYQIKEEEWGVIPMSDVPTKEQVTPRTFRIGTSGGYTHPATGYTFAFTQKRLQRLVENIAQANGAAFTLPTLFTQRKHTYYSAVLLNVLDNKRYPSPDIFVGLFQKNRPSLVFKFLAAETTFWEEIKIMWSTPILIFGKAAIAVIGRRIKEKIKK
jgi:lycopene beta-cyclase